MILGLDKAGKTTIVKKFCGEDIKTISPTLGFNIKTLHHRNYTLNIWDVGGQQTIRSYWRNYFEKTDGIIWVVDSVDTQRLQDCKKELHALLKEERLAGASLLMFVNKQDLPKALSPEQIAKILDLKVMKSRHHHVQKCSAVTGNGLMKGMDWIVADIASRIFMLE